MHRHKGVAWQTVLARLEASPSALASLGQMKASGGEPDVIGQADATGQFIYCDCSLESPQGRRSLCFDREALNARKENKPKGSAVEMALEMGIELLTMARYSSITTGRSRTMQRGASVASFASEVALLAESTATVVHSYRTTPLWQEST